MPKRHQILIIGHDKHGFTPEHEKVAYETGAEVAKSGSVLITGGLEGVMKAACHGAQDAGGITVGIIPQDDSSFANEYCDIVIPSGMGFARDFLNALSADGIIIIGGGSGTLAEVCAGYMQKKITDLWEPRWQWDMNGLLCKECFDKKEESFNVKKNYCSLCGAKLGLFRHNPKGKWKIEGQLCRSCWDSKKAELG